MHRLLWYCFLTSFRKENTGNVNHTKKKKIWQVSKQLQCVVAKQTRQSCRSLSFFHFHVAFFLLLSLKNYQCQPFQFASFLSSSSSPLPSGRVHTIWVGDWKTIERWEETCAPCGVRCLCNKLGKINEEIWWNKEHSLPVKRENIKALRNKTVFCIPTTETSRVGNGVKNWP